MLLAPTALTADFQVRDFSELEYGFELLRSLSPEQSDGTSPLAERCSRLLVDAVALSEPVDSGTSLKYGVLSQLDDYLKIRRAASPRPELVFLASLIAAQEAYIDLAGRTRIESKQGSQVEQGLCTLQNLLSRTCGFNLRQATRIVAPLHTDKVPLLHEELLDCWKRGHWIFFVITQGMILSLRRVGQAMDREDYANAELELNATSQLLWASGGAMEITGGFSAEEYHATVRPTMTEGATGSEVSTNMSGTMTWDHHFLVNQVWKNELSLLRERLPSCMKEPYADFVEAYRAGLAHGHRAVCSKFVGSSMGSLIAPATPAVQALDRIQAKREAQLTS